MLQTVEAEYHDGVLKLKQKPSGIKNSRAVVVFLDSEKPVRRNVVDWENLEEKRSAVDKWIGIIQGAQPSDFKEERRAYIEGKHK